MGTLHVCFGDVEIVVDHIERRVSEKPLKREDVAVVAEIPNRKGVTESVGVHIIHAAAPCQVLEHLPDRIGGHGEKSLMLESIFHFCNVEPDGSSSGVA